MNELIHQFGIDWRLLAAQAVNFFILFFLLYRFAYRPVLAMLSSRRAGIEAGIRMQEEAAFRLVSAASERDAMLKKAQHDGLAVVERAEAAGKERGETIIRQALEKEERILVEGKAKAEERQRELADAFAKEAAELVRGAVARVVELSPDKIDRELVKKAVEAAERAPARSL